MNSLQRIFDAAWEHFIVNDEPPAMEKLQRFDASTRYVCVYLSDEGRKCAVGLCIPDGHEGQKFDGPIGELMQAHPDLFPDLANMNKDVLDGFQASLHDFLTMDGKWQDDVEERRRKYLSVAKEHNLEVPGGK